MSNERTVNLGSSTNVATNGVGLATSLPFESGVKKMSEIEIIVGTGHQKSLHRVLKIAEEELHRMHGAARRLVLRGSGMEVIATRHKFDGDFHSFAVRLRPASQLLNAIKDRRINNCRDLLSLSRFRRRDG